MNERDGLSEGALPRVDRCPVGAPVWGSGGRVSRETVSPGHRPPRSDTLGPASCVEQAFGQLGGECCPQQAAATAGSPAGAAWGASRALVELVETGLQSEVGLRGARGCDLDRLDQRGVGLGER